MNTLRAAMKQLCAQNTNISNNSKICSEKDVPKTILTPTKQAMTTTKKIPNRKSGVDAAKLHTEISMKKQNNRVNEYLPSPAKVELNGMDSKMANKPANKYPKLPLFIVIQAMTTLNAFSQTQQSLSQLQCAIRVPQVGLAFAEKIFQRRTETMSKAASIRYLAVSQEKLES